MNLILIIQARVNSQRLKSKSILPIFNNKSSLEIIIDKFKKIKEISKIYVASGSKEKNKKILKIVNKKNVNIYFGSENDVRKRYEKIISLENPDLIIRATADNPLVDIKLSKFLINYLKLKKNCSYVKFYEKYIPTGSGIEVFRRKFFFKHLNSDNSNFAKEHVTYHMMKKKGAKFLKPPKKISTSIPLRITIDNYEDLKFIRYLYSNINNPDIFKINKYLENLIK